MKSKPLQEHITASYTTLRIGMAALAIALPVLLWLLGHIVARLPLQGSMSAYYHAGGLMRDVFVGFLFATGFFLMLYKGFTRFENWALNLAGGFLLIVAAVPMPWGCGDDCPKLTLHGAAAVLFFICIAYVCLFRSTDTLGLVESPATAALYEKAYRTLGGIMIASPAIALALKLFLQPDPGKGAYIFFIEAVGVVVFGLYWLVKSKEIWRTNAELQAAEGELEMPPYGVGDFFKRIPVRRTDRASR